MINQELKKAAHEPAHDAVIHNYDRTQLHTCIDEACPHRGRTVHYLGMFGATWIDDIGRIHNHCELKPLPKPSKTKTPRASQIHATDLDGTRTRILTTAAGAKRREAIQIIAREQERIAYNKSLPTWMLKPCPFYAQTPNDCLYGLDKCEEAKACFLRRLAVPRREKQDERQA